LLSLAGIILIVIGKKHFPELSAGFYKGIILGILTAITFGGYIFFSADLMRDYRHDPLSIIRFLFKIFVISAIICTPFMLLSKPLPHTPKQWFWLLEMGIMQI
jgi:drug/metabolite transporter (DMT)-like permease